MFTAQMGGAYNVEGSFNDYFGKQLTAAGLPDFMSTAVVNFNYPDQPLTLPSFSVSHLGSVPGMNFEGANLDAGMRGGEQVGIAQIDCWESMQRSSGLYPRNLAIMRDMAARVFATGAIVPMLDVYSSTASPSSNGTIIRAGRANYAPMMTDPNPDIRRIRMTVEYRWLERVSA